MRSIFRDNRLRPGLGISLIAWEIIKRAIIEGLKSNYEKKSVLSASQNKSSELEIAVFTPSFTRKPFNPDTNAYVKA